VEARRFLSYYARKVLCAAQRGNLAAVKVVMGRKAHDETSDGPPFFLIRHLVNDTSFLIIDGCHSPLRRSKRISEIGEQRLTER